jgi:hypothetical protein
MKTYVGIVIQPHAFLTSKTRHRWTVSSKLPSLYLRGKTSHYTLGRKLNGLHSRIGVGGGILLSPGIECPPSSQHLSLIWATPASTRTDFSLLPNTQTGTGAHLASYSTGTVILSRDNRPGHEVNHLPPSTVTVKDGWCYNSTPPICLNGGDKEIFTFLLYSCSSRQKNSSSFKEMRFIIFTTAATEP